MSEIEHTRKIIADSVDGMEKEFEGYARFGHECQKGLALILEGLRKIQSGKGSLNIALELLPTHYTNLSEVAEGSNALQRPLDRMFDILRAMTDQSADVDAFLEDAEDMVDPDCVPGIVPQEVADNVQAARAFLEEIRAAGNIL